MVEVQPDWKYNNEVKRDALCDEITANSKKVYEAYLLFKKEWMEIESTHY